MEEKKGLQSFLKVVLNALLLFGIPLCIGVDVYTFRIFRMGDDPNEALNAASIAFAIFLILPTFIALLIMAITDRYCDHEIDMNKN